MITVEEYNKLLNEVSDYGIDSYKHDIFIELWA